MKSFKKYYIIPATPEDVYLALTTETTVILWTGDQARIDAIVGGEFSMWDGAICGRFVELAEGKKIVQEWFFGEQVETSLATMKLHEHKKGTSLELSHTNIPDEDYEEIVDGWDNVYMENLIDFYREE